MDHLSWKHRTVMEQDGEDIKIAFQSVSLGEILGSLKEVSMEFLGSEGNKQEAGKKGSSLSKKYLTTS